MTENAKPSEADAPLRIRAVDIRKRFGRETQISEHTAGDWLRAMVAAGVLKKLRGITVGRWSEVDAWVASGGQVEKRGRR